MTLKSGFFDPFHDPAQKRSSESYRKVVDFSDSWHKSAKSPRHLIRMSRNDPFSSEKSLFRHFRQIIGSSEMIIRIIRKVVDFSDSWHKNDKMTNSEKWTKKVVQKVASILNYANLIFTVFPVFAKIVENTKKCENAKICKNDENRKKDFKKGEMIFQIDTF